MSKNAANVAGDPRLEKVGEEAKNDGHENTEPIEENTKQHSDGYAFVVDNFVNQNHCESISENASAQLDKHHRPEKLEEI